MDLYLHFASIITFDHYSEFNCDIEWDYFLLSLVDLIYCYEGIYLN